MKRKSFDNVWYYFKQLTDSVSYGSDGSDGSDPDHGQVLYNTVATFLNIEIKPDYVSLHYILALIYRHLFSEGGNDNGNGNGNGNKNIYVLPKQEHLYHMLLLEEEPIPLTKNGLPQIYNTLLHKRKVGIDEHIGSFMLARDKTIDVVNSHWFHWEYYALGSPLWLARLKKHGGFVIEETKKIAFDSEQGEEDFYDLYAYELDELPNEVQFMSMKPLLKQSGDVWYKYIFADGAGAFHNNAFHNNAFHY
jgi:hypothetical protein